MGTQREWHVWEAYGAAALLRQALTDVESAVESAGSAEASLPLWHRTMAAAALVDTIRTAMQGNAQNPWWTCALDDLEYLWEHWERRRVELAMPQMPGHGFAAQGPRHSTSAGPPEH